MPRRVARGNRRRTFWLGVTSLLEQDTEAGNGTVTGDASWGTDNDPYQHDPTPTLVRIVGNLVVRANRIGVDTNPATAEALWSWAITAQERITGQDVIDVSDAADLGDERILVSKHGCITAPIVARPYWDGSSVEQTLRAEHAGNYPVIVDIDVRAQRKFEETTKLVFVASVSTPASPAAITEFDTTTLYFRGRALFKAS